MSDNTQSTNLDNNMAPQRDRRAPPEITPASIEALRSVIGGIVTVTWYDPRTISDAPWDSDYRPEDMTPDVCYSIGMSDDLPDEMAILVRPHFVPDLFEDNEGRNLGEIVIPYRSIRIIRSLVAGDEKFTQQQATGEHDERY